MDAMALKHQAAVAGHLGRNSEVVAGRRDVVAAYDCGGVTVRMEAQACHLDPC